MVLCFPPFLLCLGCRRSQSMFKVCFQPQHLPVVAKKWWLQTSQARFSFIKRNCLESMPMPCPNWPLVPVFPNIPTRGAGLSLEKPLRHSHIVGDQRYTGTSPTNLKVMFLAFRCCLIAFRCYVCSRATARNHVLDFALLLFEGLNTGELCKINMFNQIDATDILFFSGLHCVSVQQLGSLCLFAIGTASLKPQHLRTMTLITQHKPIERSTDMVFMTKNTQIQAWLSGLYTENPYGQRMTSKHVHAQRRPGVPAPVMIRRNPILHHPWRSGAANKTAQPYP